ncbi:MAG TPA: hypothetical protein DCQ98_03340 [Planctomycetaceae bacterium]|nr:hypothetical protein [Planctomycetaceae bacterium]
MPSRSRPSRLDLSRDDAVDSGERPGPSGSTGVSDTIDRRRAVGESNSRGQVDSPVSTVRFRRSRFDSPVPGRRSRRGDSIRFGWCSVGRSRRKGRFREWSRGWSPKNVDSEIRATLM